MERREVKKLTILIAISLGLFFVHSFEYFYANYLRNQAEKSQGTLWHNTCTNGVTTFSVPWLQDIGYITKINAIKQTGFPCDPYTHETGIKTWLFDSVTNYIIYGWCAFFKRIDIGYTFFAYLCPSLWFIWGFLFLSKLMPKANDWEIALYSVLLAEYLVVFTALTGGFSLGKLAYYGLNFGVMYRGAVANVPSPLFTSLFAVAWWGYLAIGDSLLCLGITAGLILLVHPPEWVFCMGVLGCYLLRTFNNKMVGIMTIAGVVGGSIFIMGNAAGRMEKLPSIVTMGRWMAWAYLLVGILCEFKTRKGERQFWLVSSSAMFMMFILMRLDLIMPVPMEFSVLERFTKPILMILIFKLIHEYLSPWIERFPVPALIASCMIVFFNAKSSAEKHYLYAGLPKDWENGFAWLNKNTPKDSTLLTISPLISQLVAIHTHNKLLVEDGHPTIGSQSQEQNSMNTAVLVNTLGIDKDLFIKKYYNAQYGNLNLNFYYDRGEDLSAFLWGLDGFVHVTQYPKQPHLQEILDDMKKGDTYPNGYIWMNKGEDFKVGKPVFESPLVEIRQ